MVQSVLYITTRYVIHTHTQTQVHHSVSPMLDSQKYIILKNIKTG